MISLIPGVLVFRPEVDTDFILNEVKNNLNIKNKYIKWGDNKGYLQADISPYDDSTSDIFKDIRYAYSNVFYSYLKQIENLNVLPNFIDYSGRSNNWIPDETLRLQLHAKQLDLIEDSPGLGLHVDVHPDSEKYNWRNMFTIIFYLNDDYEGGEICFTYGDDFNNIAFPNKDIRVLRYKPKAGDFVVFPAHFPHAAYMCQGNDRYAIVRTYKYILDKDMSMSKFIPNDVYMFRNIKYKDYETDYVNGRNI